MSMNRILSFMPFGAQYYRAPTPLPEEWDADLRRMRDAGFNTIKVWAQWRWNNPAEGRFDFSDLTLLLDTAQAHGLRVVVNLIMDCAPAWLFAAYPDCRMVTAGGRTLGPVTTPYRQIGGVPGHCLHHKAAVKHSVRFVEEAAKALGTHPSLAFWDLWNEPELTVGLLREPKIGDLVCACPSSRAAFLDWLECRYSSLERLNRVWSRNYQTWDEVELPVQPQTYRDSVLPPAVTARVAVEAGVTTGWQKWVGDRGAVVGVDRFGASAPYKEIYQHFGLTPERVAQANLTATLAPEYQGAGLEHSLATVLGSGDRLDAAIVASEWEGVDVVPAGGEDLADAQQTLVIQKAGRELRLRRALASVAARYDLVVLDCPPSLDQLTINALSAADALVIVTDPGQYAALLRIGSGPAR